jgi:hypothetical protein
MVQYMYLVHVHTYIHFIHTYIFFTHLISLHYQYCRPLIWHKNLIHRLLPQTNRNYLVLPKFKHPLIWTYAHKEGPKTILECALTLLNEDLWSYQTTCKPWIWFNTHNLTFALANYAG